MQTKRVEEIMIPLSEYPHISDKCTLRDAIEAFQTSKGFDIGGRKSLPRTLLVFDDLHVLVGLIRRRDILRGIEPEFLVDKSLKDRKSLFNLKIDPELMEFSFDHIIDGIKTRANAQVSEVMSPITAFVHHDDHIAKVIYDLVAFDISLVPVVKDDEVVGVVRSVDVFAEAASLISR